MFYSFYNPFSFYVIFKISRLQNLLNFVKFLVEIIIPLDFYTLLKSFWLDAHLYKMLLISNV